jgi:hypothetical protein
MTTPKKGTTQNTTARRQCFRLKQTFHCSQHPSGIQSGDNQPDSIHIVVVANNVP